MRQVLCHGRLGWRLLEDGLASVVNVRGPRLPAIGESLPRVGKVGVCAVLLDQLRNGVAPTPAAWLADDRQRRFADVGQRALGHPAMIERTVNYGKDGGLEKAGRGARWSVTVCSGPTGSFSCPMSAVGGSQR
jgi:hypothetical protein